MILVYEDLKLIINTAHCILIECADQPTQKEGSEEVEMAHLIVFASASGMARPIAYPNAEIRDSQFQAIKEKMVIESQAKAGNAIVPVKLHPAQGGARGMIHTR